MENQRKIIHIDMDAFYASIEQRDNPKLKGKPVVVGGDPHGRGVVATCSYEARKYGIHSAMPCKTAYKRCPYAIFVRPRFEVYRQISHEIREIFHKYTDLVEPLSFDEAYLDITENKLNIKYATEIAELIKKEIYEKTKLTASAGVSYNKFLAKLASDYNKPNGLTIIRKDNTQIFLDNLPINKFFGIGKVTQRLLHNLNIKTGYDLRQLDVNQLEFIFKNRGYLFYQLARGIDHREVEPHRERKSIGSETTLIENLNIEDEKLINILDELCKEVSNRANYLKKRGKTVVLKIKYSDFTQITRSLSVNNSIYSHEDIRTNIYSLFKNIEHNNQDIRLIGVTLSNLVNEEVTNITLFEYIKTIEK